MTEARSPEATTGLDTAAEHASKEVPIVGPGLRVSDVRRSLEGRRFATAAAVAVCRDGLLLGLIRNEDLLAARADEPIDDLIDDAPPVVAPGTDQEAAAWKAADLGESVLAVVDERGRFSGFVPPQALLTLLLREHDEDLSRLAGVLHGTTVARAASRESLLRRYWHRLPWLLIGLAGALVAAGIVGSFERELEANVMIAFFIPGIVYMADAVRTQTETIVVRGLSVGVPIREVVRRELLTGLLVGVTLSALFLAVGLWRWDDAELIVGTALALLMACSIATVIAMTLPWLIHRLGGDPAFGSGPLATVLQDLLSVLIYFATVLVILD